MNWLFNAIMDQSPAAFTLAVGNSSSVMFDQVFDTTISLNGVDYCNVLHVAAGALSPEHYQQLINRMPEAILKSHASNKNSLGESGFVTALLKQQNTDSIELLINKLDFALINRLAADALEQNITPLLAALNSQNEIIFNRLVDAYTNERLVLELSLRNELGVNLFSLLAYQLSLESLQLLLNRLTQAELEQLVLSMSNVGASAMHDAAVVADGQKFQLLLDRISDDVLVQLVKQEANDGWNVIHCLANDGCSERIVELMRRLPREVFVMCISRRTQRGWHAWVMALPRITTHLFETLLAFFSDQELNELLETYPRSVGNPLICIIQYHGEEVFLSVFFRLIEKTRVAITKLVDTQNGTVLAMAALQFSGSGLHTLLSALPSEVIDMSLELQLSHEQYAGWNLLHAVSRASDERCFNYVVQHASEKALMTAVRATCRNESARGWTPLHQALVYRSSDAVKALLQKLPTDSLDSLMKIATLEGWTVLHYAAFHLEAQVILDLVNRLSVETLSSVLVLEARSANMQRENFLQKLLYSQSFAVIQAVADKVDQAALEKAFLAVSQEVQPKGQSALGIILFQHTPQMLEYFIQKVSTAVMQQAILTSFADEATAVHTAMLQLNPESVLGLCHQLTDEQFDQLMQIQAQIGGLHQMTCLQSALIWQPPQVAEYLLQRMSPSCLQSILMIKSTSGRMPFPTIVSLYPCAMIRYVMQFLSPEDIRESFAIARQNLYQCLMLNSALENAEAETLLEELR